MAAEEDLSRLVGKEKGECRGGEVAKPGRGGTRTDQQDVHPLPASFEGVRPSRSIRRVPYI